MVGSKIGVGVMWGMEDVKKKNRRYCTMYIKVKYNIKDNKKNPGGGGGAIFE